MVAGILIPSTNAFVYIDTILLKHQVFGKVNFEIERTRESIYMVAGILASTNFFV